MLKKSNFGGRSPWKCQNIGAHPPKKLKLSTSLRPCQNIMPVIHHYSPYQRCSTRVQDLDSSPIRVSVFLDLNLDLRPQDLDLKPSGLETWT